MNKSIEQCGNGGCCLVDGKTQYDTSGFQYPFGFGESFYTLFLFLQVIKRAMQDGHMGKFISKL